MILFLNGIANHVTSFIQFDAAEYEKYIHINRIVSFSIEAIPVSFINLPLIQLNRLCCIQFNQIPELEFRSYLDSSGENRLP